MRNKVFLTFAVICCLILTLGVLAACNDEKGEGGQSATTGESYVIQYTDDTGTYSIDVKQGEPYSMSAIPTREGYDFIGLFDAEVVGRNTSMQKAHRWRPSRTARTSSFSRNSRRKSSDWC